MLDGGSMPRALQYAGKLFTITLWLVSGVPMPLNAELHVTSRRAKIAISSEAEINEQWRSLSKAVCNH